MLFLEMTGCLCALLQMNDLLCCRLQRSYFTDCCIHVKIDFVGTAKQKSFAWFRNLVGSVVAVFGDGAYVQFQYWST